VIIYETGGGGGGGGGGVRHTLAHDEAVTRVAFLPGSPMLAVATADGLVAVYDARDGTRAAALTGHQGAVLDMAVGGGGAVVTAGDDGVCRVFTVR
jgi:ribosome assembly protein SQT1